LEISSRKSWLINARIPGSRAERGSASILGMGRKYQLSVILTEGEKKAAALISRGYAAIGLPGINSGYRVTEKGDWITKPDGTQYQRATAWELHLALQPLDTAGREITIIFDYRAGDYSESPEFKAASTTAKLFKNAIAKIGELPGPDKGVDDFLVAGGDIDAVIADAKNYRKLAIQKQWRRNRQYTPDRTINSRYFTHSHPQQAQSWLCKRFGDWENSMVERCYR
jgi:hypothetical protein